MGGEDDGISLVHPNEAKAPLSLFGRAAAGTDVALYPGAVSITAQPVPVTGGEVVRWHNFAWQNYWLSVRVIFGQTNAAFPF